MIVYVILLLQSFFQGFIGIAGFLMIQLDFVSALLSHTFETQTHTERQRELKRTATFITKIFFANQPPTKKQQQYFFINMWPLSVSVCVCVKKIDLD